MVATAGLRHAVRNNQLPILVNITANRKPAPCTPIVDTILDLSSMESDFVASCVRVPEACYRDIERSAPVRVTVPIARMVKTK